MNFECTYVPFSDLFDWKEKSKIKSGDGKVVGKYKMFICSDTETKRYDNFLHSRESLVFGTGGKASCHYVNEPFAYSTDCIVAQPKIQGIYVKFYYYYLRQNRLALLQSTFTGSGLQHTSKKKIEKILVPIFDYIKQKEIVDKIEELFSQLDSGVEMIKKVKQQLEIYKQAVLKKAFEIASNDTSVKHLSIEELLVTNRKGMSTGPFGSMIKKQDHLKDGVPMLGIENIGNGKFIYGNKIFVSEEKAKELKSFKLEENDIIISRSGTIGKICSVPKEMEGALLSTNLMRVSLNENIIKTEFFIYLFQSKGIVLDQVKELCKGSTREFLNQNILKRIIFPVPSLKTQKNIIENIDILLSNCIYIDNIVNTGLKEVDLLKQSILKKAFE